MKDGVRTEIRDVTPEQAKVWLAGKTPESLRLPNERHVQALAADMTSGQWRLTGDGLSFNKDGKLFDGQHRLAAVVHANVTVKMLVVWGLDDSHVIDHSRITRPYYPNAN